MSIYRVQTTIDGVFTNMDLVLDAKHILLSYDGGQSYASTDLFDVTNKLVLQWIGIGLSFQSWTITVLMSAQKADGTFDDDKKWSTTGTIPQGGGSQVYQEIDPTKLVSAK
jgi:hypothetical protein